MIEESQEQAWQSLNEHLWDRLKRGPAPQTDLLDELLPQWLEHIRNHGTSSDRARLWAFEYNKEIIEKRNQFKHIYDNI